MKAPPRKTGSNRGDIGIRNPYALDYAAAAMVGIRPERVPTVSRAAERGLFAAGPDGLDIVGDMDSLCCIKNYDTPAIVSASFTRGNTRRLLKIWSIGQCSRNRFLCTGYVPGAATALPTVPPMR